MKKTLTGLAALVLTASMAVHAQTEKKIPPPPPPRPTQTLTSPTPPRQIDFYKAYPAIARLHWSDANKVSVKLKNGLTENYDLSNEAQEKSFQEKYGIPPMPPPPPPPPKK